MPTFRRIRRSIAATLLVLYLPSCSHWVTPTGMTPQEYVAAKHPKEVRVTLNDSSRLVLHAPWVSPDSLGGRRLVRDSRGFLTEPDSSVWAVSLRSVGRIQVRKTDVPATAVATFFGVVLVGEAIAFAICAASDCLSIN